MPLHRGRPDECRSHRRRRRRPAGTVSRSARRGWPPHPRGGGAEPAGGALDCPLSEEPGTPADGSRPRDDCAGADRHSRRATARHGERRARFHRSLRSRGAESGRDTWLSRLALASTADPGDRCGRAPRHRRRQSAGRHHHRISRRLAARPLRRGRLRSRARGRRTFPGARTADHGSRRGGQIGCGPCLGDRHNESVRGDRRLAVDGVRPGEMVGRAPLSRACRHRPAVDLGR